MRCRGACCLNFEQLRASKGAPARDATVASSTINLLNTILGTGMLSLPYAIAVCGLVLGIVMLLLR